MANSDLLTGNLRKVFSTPSAGPGARNDDEPTVDPWQRPRVATGTPSPADVETEEGIVRFRPPTVEEVVLKAIDDLPLEDTAPMRLSIEPGYEGLAAILDEALAQAQSGKGKDRHQQRADQRFEDQPMQILSDLFASNVGMGFQAAKKIAEACSQIDRGNVEGGVRDLLGAIIYTAGIVVRARKGS